MRLSAAALVVLLLSGCPAVDEAPEAELVLGAEVVCASPEPAGAPLRFDDVTDEAGIGFSPSPFPWPLEPPFTTIDIEMTGGFIVGDLDVDGALDLLFADRRREPRVFLGNGALGFEAVAADDLGIPTGPFYGGASAADADGDGDLDLLLLARERNVFLENRGGVFVDRSEDSGLAGEDVRSASASWADFDRDDDLDVFVTNHGVGAVGAGDDYPAHRDGLFRQRPDGAFADAIDDLIPVDRDGYGYACGWFDADDDGWLDLYVVNDLAAGDDKPPNAFVHNLGSGDDDRWEFEPVPEAGLDVPLFGMGLAVGDMDVDGDLDLHVTTIGPTFLARNLGDLDFVDDSASVTSLSAREEGDVSWSTRFFDHDADGRLELYVAYGQLLTHAGGHGGGGAHGDDDDDSGGGPPDDGGHDSPGGPLGSANRPDQPDMLWAWDSAGESWFDTGPLVGIDDSAVTRNSEAVDLDGDGFEELVTWSLLGGPRLYRSRCNSNAWLLVRLEQPGSGNRDAIGARVFARSPAGDLVAAGDVEVGSAGALTAGPPEVHLGLGSADTVDLEVRWPDGERTVNRAVPTRREVVVRR